MGIRAPGLLKFFTKWIKVFLKECGLPEQKTMLRSQTDELGVGPRLPTFCELEGPLWSAAESLPAAFIAYIFYFLFDSAIDKLTLELHFEVFSNLHLVLSRGVSSTI